MALGPTCAHATARSCSSLPFGTEVFPAKKKCPKALLELLPIRTSLLVHTNWAVGAGDEQEANVLVFTVRETSPLEMMRTEALRAASLISSTDATGPGVSRLEEAVFDRRVRLTVLRAAGLAQVRNVIQIPESSIDHRCRRRNSSIAA